MSALPVGDQMNKEIKLINGQPRRSLNWTGHPYNVLPPPPPAIAMVQTKVKPILFSGLAVLAVVPPEAGRLAGREGIGRVRCLLGRRTFYAEYSILRSIRQKDLTNRKTGWPFVRRTCTCCASFLRMSFGLSRSGPSVISVYLLQ